MDNNTQSCNSQESSAPQQDQIARDTPFTYSNPQDQNFPDWNHQRPAETLRERLRVGRHRFVFKDEPDNVYIHFLNSPLRPGRESENIVTEMTRHNFLYPDGTRRSFVNGKENDEPFRLGHVQGGNTREPLTPSRANTTGYINPSIQQGNPGRQVAPPPANAPLRFQPAQDIQQPQPSLTPPSRPGIAIRPHAGREQGVAPLPTNAPLRFQPAPNLGQHPPLPPSALPIATLPDQDLRDPRLEEDPPSSS